MFNTNKIDPSLCVDLGTGSLSSVCSITICQPLFMIKNAFMTNMKLPKSPKDYYRGYFMSNMCDQSNQPISFMINGIFSQLVLQGRSPTFGEKILGGLTSAVVVSPFLSFYERVMILQQLHTPSKTFHHVIKKIYTVEGIRGFFKGINFTIGRESINAMCFFYIEKDLAKRLSLLIKDKGKTDSIAFFASGLLAGFLTTPFDLFKTITQSELGENKRTSIKEITNMLVKEHKKKLLPFLIRSCASRTLLIGCLLGSLGTASECIRPYLLSIFHHNPNEADNKSK